MTKEDIVLWKNNEVTQHLLNELEKAREVTMAELLHFGTETKALSNKYFYLQGKVDGINLVLEANLEEDDNENV